MESNTVYLAIYFIVLGLVYLIISIKYSPKIYFFGTTRNYDTLVTQNKIDKSFKPDLKQIEKRYAYYEKNISDLHHFFEIVYPGKNEEEMLFASLLEGNYFCSKDKKEEKIYLEAFLVMSFANEWFPRKKIYLLVEEKTTHDLSFKICCNFGGWGDLFHEPSPSLELVF